MIQTTTDTWEERFKKLFQESDYVDDRGNHWCVDGFVFKDKFISLLKEAKEESVRECVGIVDKFPHFNHMGCDVILKEDLIQALSTKNLLKVK